MPKSRPRVTEVNEWGWLQLREFEEYAGHDENHLPPSVEAFEWTEICWMMIGAMREHCFGEEA